MLSTNQFTFHPELSHVKKCICIPLFNCVSPGKPLRYQTLGIPAVRLPDPFSLRKSVISVLSRNIYIDVEQLLYHLLFHAHFEWLVLESSFATFILYKILIFEIYQNLVHAQHKGHKGSINGQKCTPIYVEMIKQPVFCNKAQDCNAYNKGVWSTIWQNWKRGEPEWISFQSTISFLSKFKLVKKQRAKCNEDFERTMIFYAVV